MKKPILADLVAATGDLATLPATLVQLLDLLKDATCSASEVVNVLERDPAMTTNVLKLGNSAFYGARREIKSVREALVMLGNRSVATLAFASGMAPVLRRELNGYGLTRERFWSHSLRTAAASAIAADRLGYGDLRCESFTAGLVHDVGMLVLDDHLVATNQALDGADTAWDVCTAERELLGFDHAEAGAMLAEQWGFPDVLVTVIRDHHLVESAESQTGVVEAVAAGNILAQFVEQDSHLVADDFVRSIFARLEVDDEFLSQLRLDLSSNLDETLARATRPAAVKA